MKIIRKKNCSLLGCHSNALYRINLYLNYTSFHVFIVYCLLFIVKSKREYLMFGKDFPRFSVLQLMKNHDNASGGEVSAVNVVILIWKIKTLNENKGFRILMK